MAFFLVQKTLVVGTNFGPLMTESAAQELRSFLNANVDGEEWEVKTYDGNLKIGDRVYYRDNGPEDTGTVREVAVYENPSKDITFFVEWDNGKENDYYDEKQLMKVTSK